MEHSRRLTCWGLTVSSANLRNANEFVWYVTDEELFENISIKHGNLKIST